MNITNAKYASAPPSPGGGDPDPRAGIHVTIDGMSLSVPIDPANRHYQMIQEWVAEGNTIEEAD
jgi:hypothetical protein